MQYLLITMDDALRYTLGPAFSTIELEKWTLPTIIFHGGPAQDMTPEDQMQYLLITKDDALRCTLEPISYTIE